MTDVQINVAIGVSADSRQWKNKTMMWSDMRRRLSEHVKTNETHKEFINMPKSDQSKIKDVGGYVGGYLQNGRRNQASVMSRQLVTLDIDFAHSNFWEDFKLIFDCASVIHGTHKHIESSPRYRLVIPLDKEVTPDEYVAISRKIAEMMGIDLFDNTTFDPCRLMFWGSSPKDVDYYFEYQDGEILSAQSILDMYTDWKDVSSWATSGETLKDLKDRSKKQEDPTLKKGIIGAFCRTYSITEAIREFLSEEYLEGTEGRFTYVNGTTANGLVIYDDKFAFSHHGTDPASGQQCNAFDLVRIHKFGFNDSDADSKTSYKMMEELCINDEKTKATIGAERVASAKYDFVEFDDEFDDEIGDILGVTEKVEKTDWMAQLEVDGKSNYLSNSTNLNLIFQNDSRLKDTFRLNQFDNRMYVFNTLPWRRVPKAEPIKNVDLSGVRNYLDTMYKITGAQKIEDALNLEFERNAYHPVRNYLSSLKWDGVQRVETMLSDYFGAPDDLYHREAIRCVMVAGVKRIFEPGCKFDLVLTLVGGQGVGKSTFVKKLGVDWFSDTFLGVEGTKAMEQINSGVWVMEIAELAGLKKSEVEPIKQFISKGEDTFRPAYGKTVETYKRQCIFIGTTNDENFLRDPTGNRRFLPVDVRPDRIKKSTKFDMDRKEVDQLWAEAYQMYRKGVKTYMSDEAEELAKIEQQGHTLVDERTGLIERYLETPIPVDWKNYDINDRNNWINYEENRDPLIETEMRDTVCIAEVFCECLGKKKEDMTPYNTKEINALMKTLSGWEYVKTAKRFGMYGAQKYFKRIK